MIKKWYGMDAKVQYLTKFLSALKSREAGEFRNTLPKLLKGILFEIRNNQSNKK